MVRRRGLQEGSISRSSLMHKVLGQRSFPLSACDQAVGIHTAGTYYTKNNTKGCEANRERAHMSRAGGNSAVLEQAANEIDEKTNTRSEAGAAQRQGFNSHTGRTKAEVTEHKAIFRHGVPGLRPVCTSILLSTIASCFSTASPELCVVTLALVFSGHRTNTVVVLRCPLSISLSIL